jgi:hypothetical protein
MFTIPELEAARRAIPFKPIDCPHCGGNLRAHFPALVATRNCPQCGRRVVAEPDGEGPPPFTRERLDAACAAYTRTHRRVGWVFLAGFLAWLACVAALALFRDTIRDAVRPVVDPEWFGLLVMFGPCGAVFVAGLVMLDRARRAALKCPHCAAPCSVVLPRIPNLTQLTGNCARCGRRLVDEPLPEEPAGPLPTVEEFNAAERRARAGDWPLLFPLVVMFAVPLGFSVIGPDRLWNSFEERYGIMAGALLVLGILCGWGVVVAGLALAALRWAARRRERMRQAEPALNCPHCKAALCAMPQIVASRRCPSCRRRVLAEPESQTVASEG